MSSLLGADLDALRQYIRSDLWAESSLPPVKLDPDRTVLVIVDMQYLDAHRDYGMGAVAKGRGQTKEFDWYFKELSRIIRNQQQLIRACRAKGIEVVYTRISSLTRDGRDTSYFYSKTLPIVTPIDSKEAQILDEIKPEPDDIVVVKTTDSMFNSQYNTDRILRNMGIQILLICGVVSNGCVESSVRDAADLGYDVFTISDASLSFTEVQHEVAMLEQNMFYSRIKTTGEILDELNAAQQVTPKSKVKYSTISLPQETRARYRGVVSRLPRRVR
jgi:nicotinamidase-related amidase